MTQAFLLIWLAAIGGTIAQLANNKVSKALAVASAPLLGIGLSSALVVLNVLFGLGTSLVIALALELVLVHAILLAYLHKAKLFRPRLLAQTLALWLPAAFIVSSYNLAVLSYDSFELVVLGRRLAATGHFNSFLTHKLASWGVLFPAAHGLVVLTNVDFLFGLQPWIGLAFVGSWFAIGADVSRGTEIRRAKLWLILFAIGAILFSSYFIPFQFFYIHNSLPAASFLLLATYLAWKNLETKDPWYIAPATLLFSFFALQRTETPILAAMFLAVWHLIGPTSRYHFRALLLGFSLPILAWYGFLYLSIGSGSDILTPQRIGIVVSPVLVTTLLSGLLARGKPAAWHQQLVRTIPLVAAAVVVALFVLKPGHMHDSLHSLMLNLFERGRWGNLWWALAGLGLLSAFRRPFSHQTMWVVPVVTYALFILAVSAFRIPYHTGFGDSGNRMVTHIVPLVAVYLVARFAQGAPVARQPLLATRTMALLLALLCLYELNIYIERSVHDYTPNTAIVRSENIDTANSAVHALQNKSRWKHMVATEATAAVQFSFGQTIALAEIRTDHVLPSSVSHVAIYTPGGELLSPANYHTYMHQTGERELAEIKFTPAWNTDGIELRYEAPETSSTHFWRLASLYFREKGSNTYRLYPEQNFAQTAQQLDLAGANNSIDLQPILSDPPIKSVRAVHPGPLTAVVDLGAVRAIRELGLVVYSKDRAPVQYRWYTSIDNKQWQILYNSSTTDNTILETRTNDIVWTYNLTTYSPFRYLRLEFENSAHTENLFRLRHLYILGH